MTPRAVTILAGILGLLHNTVGGPVGHASTATYDTRTKLAVPGPACAVGDVGYLPGDEFPGREVCERCNCTNDGNITCKRQKCEARAGCKAVHRPDACCPTYQCECEQDGRVYANGEKLVDPVDPCKVCYCQGGEVVCRRIACFLRNDCEPRQVPGRCCPEYDHCPLRGSTTEPGKSSSITASLDSTHVVKKSENIAQKSEENVRKEITIKEVTPVSEIPAMVSGIRIKDIVSSPIAEVSKSPSDSTPKSHIMPKKPSTIIMNDPASSTEGNAENSTESPVLKIGDKLFSINNGEMVSEPPGASTPSTVITIDGVEGLQRGDVEEVETIEIEEYESSSPIIIQTNIDTTEIKSSPAIEITSSSDTPASIKVSTAPTSDKPASVTVSMTPNKLVIPEEDDAELVNPAFPPLPDDWPVLSNHEDTDTSEGHVEHIHVYTTQQAPMVTEISHSKYDIDFNSEISSSKILPDVLTFINDTNSDSATEIPEEWLKFNDSITTEKSSKDSLLLNLRSALPTYILNLPSSLPEVSTDEVDVSTDENPGSSVLSQITVNFGKAAPTVDIIDNPVLTTITVYKSDIETAEFTTKEPNTPNEVSDTTFLFEKSDPETTLLSRISGQPTPETIRETTSISIEPNQINKTSSEIEKGTTMDIKFEQSVPTAQEFETKLPEVIQDLYSTTPKSNIGSINTLTEMTTTMLVSNDIYTTSSSISEDVEVQNTTYLQEKYRNSALIKGYSNNNNVLTDLINLVGDVASIGDHTEKPKIEKSTPLISESEELIPVYENPKNPSIKPKKGIINSNNIVDTFTKKETTTKANLGEMIAIEITDDETETITDSILPNNKVEPTTRRPIIDNVSDTNPGGKKDMKDIEIITKSYVPTLSRRPTKVVMKKNNEKSVPKESMEISTTASNLYTPFTISDITKAITSGDAVDTIKTDNVERSSTLETLATSTEPTPQ